MPTTLEREDVKSRVAELQSQILAIQGKLQAVLHGNSALKVSLPELHDKASGRIDAQKVADLMGVPLKRLAEGLGLNYKAVHRNPSASVFQPDLKPVKRSLEILHEFFGKPGIIRAWLNTAHPDLDGESALEAISEGNAEAVRRILENAAAAVPI